MRFNHLFMIALAIGSLAGDQSLHAQGNGPAGQIAALRSKLVQSEVDKVLLKAELGALEKNPGIPKEVYAEQRRKIVQKLTELEQAITSKQAELEILQRKAAIDSASSLEIEFRNRELLLAESVLDKIRNRAEQVESQLAVERAKMKATKKLLAVLKLEKQRREARTKELREQLRQLAEAAGVQPAAHGHGK